MKKIFALSIIVFLLTLCFFTPVLCKGELGDNDAFSTYMGKTRSEVRRIAPTFEEFSDNLYLVDYLEEGDDFLALAVMFDEYNLVQSVMVLITKGALKILDIDESLEMIASLGAVYFGFDSDDVIRASFSKDDVYTITIKGGITIIATPLSDQVYTAMSAQK